VLFETAILGTKITCVRFGTEFTGIAIVKLLICVQKLLVLYLIKKLLVLLFETVTFRTEVTCVI
jgi:hypothetical protein